MVTDYKTILSSLLSRRAGNRWSSNIYHTTFTFASNPPRLWNKGYSHTFTINIMHEVYRKARPMEIWSTDNYIQHMLTLQWTNYRQQQTVFTGNYGTSHTREIAINYNRYTNCWHSLTWNSFVSRHEVARVLQSPCWWTPSFSWDHCDCHLCWSIAHGTGNIVVVNRVD